jgi:hypothetical protein
MQLLQLVLLPPSKAQILSLAPRSRTPSAYGLPLKCETKIHTHIIQYGTEYSDFMKCKLVLDEMWASQFLNDCSVELVTRTPYVVSPKGLLRNISNK